MIGLESIKDMHMIHCVCPNRTQQWLTAMCLPFSASSEGRIRNLGLGSKIGTFLGPFWHFGPKFGTFLERLDSRLSLEGDCAHWHGYVLRCSGVARPTFFEREAYGCWHHGNAHNLQLQGISIDFLAQICCVCTYWLIPCERNTP